RLVMNEIFGDESRIDDIQDGTIIRRRKLCAHLVYGIGRTVNISCRLLVRCFEMFSTVDNLAAMKSLSDTCKGFLHGQVMDVSRREKSICPTEDEYKLMVLNSKHLPHLTSRRPTY
ncbi:hypothetical protein ILUMI_03130, partial [Ignelater luminosus]